MKTSRPIFAKVTVFIFLYIITGTIFFASLWVHPYSINTWSGLHVTIVFFASVLLAKYFFYMLMSPFYNVKKTYERLIWKKRRPEYQPLVSVLIPAWNEEVGVLNTVSSLLDSSYEHLEIIIVNDGSTDNSDALIKQFVIDYDRLKYEFYKKSIVYKYTENGGKGKALNTGILLSKGDLIVSIDADCLVDKYAIEHFVDCFRNPTVMAAVGNVKVANTETLLGLIQSLEFLFSFYFKKADSVLNTIYIIGGAAGAFRREVFEQLGGYNDKNITEDIELSMRIQDSHMKIEYVDDAVVYTEGATDIKGLKNQRLRWKRGRFQTFFSYWYMFFSFQQRHNKFLSWVILPLALFAEVQLLMEIPFVIFLYMYSFFSSDYSSFISGIVVVSSMFVFLMMFDDKQARKISFLLVAPVAWLLFYTMTYVETTALHRSIISLLLKRNITWQRWDRAGIKK